MKINLQSIQETLNKQRLILRDNYHVKNIGVFGSVSRGDNTEVSDVDMLVEFSEAIGFFKFIELEEFLSKGIGQKVDLVTKNALKPSIRDEILQQVAYV